MAPRQPPPSFVSNPFFHQHLLTYVHRIGHSQKGWITGEIALCWIQEFERITSAKAAGRPRLLLLDGHASHLTRRFLEYARESNIIVLCYPSHATHVYQGLDVVCFRPFKHHWSAHRDEYERETGLVVQKANFMLVMSQAYTRAFTPDNIQSAFRKTGVVPFDPSAINATSMSTSTETSVKGSLPIRQPSPIQEIADALLNATFDNEDVRMSLDHEITSKIHSGLASTSFSFLVDSSPIMANHANLPMPTHYHIEPLSNETQALLNYVPQTTQESKLVHALHEFVERDRQHYEAARFAAATAVLQGIYCARLKKQLFSSEKSGDKESGRLLGDGLPAVLTSDEFLSQVVNRDERRDQQTRLKEARKEARLRHKKAVEVWQKENRKRIEQNKAEARHFELQFAQWKVERDLAKQEGRKPGWPKPKKPLRRAPVPRPILQETQAEVLGDDSSSAASLSDHEEVESDDD
jgi:hypothetical protein